MDAKHLVFFKRAAELENMTKAADELMVSQPFLSRVIAELEKELGVELFNRVGRGIILNSYGKVFYRRVINIFNEVEDAIQGDSGYSKQSAKTTYYYYECKFIYAGTIKNFSGMPSRP